MEEDRLSSLAEFLNILGVESRLRIVKLLMEYDSICVNGLAKRLGISQSAVSQHLRILSLMGLVASERIGYFTHYSLDCGKLAHMTDLFQEFCSEIGSEKRSRCLQEGGEKCAEEETGAQGLTG
ncbi:MAG: winged helix-turn-helix transcriptional regulator [Candidatus Fermentibacteraceae bacterium]|nr:winged helix-turn-helix transcriptional regulator [Candidatus Fermentibacteraceae bacterium]MBN2608136.1 winged helix-turn-helix transcriptional regulator [Candidatus Fermentibacteraceae bacterium]